MLCAVFPCFVFGLWLIYGWLPTFLHDKFDLTQADAAWNATVYLQSATAVGLLGGGVLSDWLYRALDRRPAVGARRQPRLLGSQPIPHRARVLRSPPRA